MTELQECIRSGGLSTQAARSILILTSTGMTTQCISIPGGWLVSLCGLAFFCVSSFCFQVSYKHTQIISCIGNTFCIDWEDAIFCTCTYLFSTQLLALHTSSFGASRTQLPSSTSLIPTPRLSRSLSM